jgi:hypothetical protein
MRNCLRDCREHMNDVAGIIDPSWIRLAIWTWGCLFSIPLSVWRQHLRSLHAQLGDDTRHPTSQTLGPMIRLFLIADSRRV